MNAIKTIKKIIKNTGVFRDYASYRYYKEVADSILENSQNKINTSIKKQCDEYAYDVLGSKKYSQWLKVYSTICGEFKEGWIPAYYYEVVVVPTLKNEYGAISATRSIATKLFGSEYFPDIAHYANEVFATADFEVLPLNAVKDYIFKEYDKVVYKLNASLQGTGTVIYTKENFNVEEVKSLGNGVFQYFINQHEYFDRFSTKSVATIRMTSVIDREGKASCRGAFLRIGGVNDSIVLWATNVMVSVDINTGKLSTIGYSPKMQPIDLCNAGYGISENDIIPCFDKCVEAVEKMHEKMPFNPCIGWDLIIDNNNEVKIMEWNGVHNDIVFNEAVDGPCFADLGWEKLWKMGTTV